MHGALLDARILADVYLAMTGGQGALALGEEAMRTARRRAPRRRAAGPSVRMLPVIRATEAELAAHEARAGDRQGQSAASACSGRWAECTS